MRQRFSICFKLMKMLPDPLVGQTANKASSQATSYCSIHEANKIKRSNKGKYSQIVYDCKRYLQLPPTTLISDQFLPSVLASIQALIKEKKRHAVSNAAMRWKAEFPFNKPSSADGQK